MFGTYKLEQLFSRARVTTNKKNFLPGTLSAREAKLGKLGKAAVNKMYEMI